MPEFSYAPPSLSPAEVEILKKEQVLSSRKSKRWLFLIIGLLMILSVPVILGSMYYQEVYRPASPSGPEVTFTIAPGSSTDEVISTLIEKGLLDQPTFFKIYLRISGTSNDIQAGNFSIPQNISIADLAAKLGVAEREQVTLTIIEGWRREEIADYLNKRYLEGEIGFTGDEFSDLALNPPASVRQKLGSRLPSDASLQGFLFPDTYNLDGDAKALDLVNAMVDAYLAKVTAEVRAGFAAESLTEREALILAAIVEREAYAGEERPIIAEILLQRLRTGEILGTDAPVQYALGYSDEEKTWWRKNLTFADLEVDSPYNTRRRAGLPPAPIANPGIEAIKAVAFPAETPYLYYLHDAEGTIHYARTLEEHNANVAQYLQ